MEEILSNRDQDIDQFTSFTTETKRELNEFVSKLGWNEETTAHIERVLVCPFNSSHRLHPKSVEKHIEKCLWNAEGYSDDDLPLSIPSVPPDATTCIKLDQQAIENILQHSKPQDPLLAGGLGCTLIPRTSNRLLTSFTPEERKIIYDYVISHTEQPYIGEDIADLNKTKNDDNDSKTSSYLELLAQERNLKRRRAKHRGVHTNKKSQTEIMREVINQQMEMLAEYLAEKDESNKIVFHTEEPLKHQKKDSTHGIHSINSNREGNSSKESPRGASNEFYHRHERNLSTDIRRESSRDNYHQYNVYNSNSNTMTHSKPSKSSRNHDSRERHSHRHSEELKKYKKHSRSRSRNREYDHKHKSKSRKRSRSRDNKKSRKRRRSPY